MPKKKEGCNYNEIVALVDADKGDPDLSHFVGIIGPLIYNDSL